MGLDPIPLWQRNRAMWLRLLTGLAVLFLLNVALVGPSKAAMSFLAIFAVTSALTLAIYFTGALLRYFRRM